MAKTGDCVVKHGANFTTGMAMVVSTFMLQQMKPHSSGSREGAQGNLGHHHIFGPN